MGLLTRLLGQEGKVRYEFETLDGQVAIAKTYVEMFNVSDEQLKKELERIIFVETGHKVKYVKILGFASVR